MADQDVLSAKLDAILGLVGNVATDLGDFAAQLKALQGQVNPDLSALISKADSISTALNAALAANPDPGPVSTGATGATGG